MVRGNLHSATINALHRDASTIPVSFDYSRHLGLGPHVYWLYRSLHCYKQLYHRLCSLLAFVMVAPPPLSTFKANSTCSSQWTQLPRPPAPPTKLRKPTLCVFTTTNVSIVVTGGTAIL